MSVKQIHLTTLCHKYRVLLYPFIVLSAALLLLQWGGVLASDSAAYNQISGLLSADDSPHNVLLIIADDMGVEMLQGYGEGSDYPPTPNIDKLFDEGVFFRNAWAAPICSPTRATMLTGRYGFRTGVGDAVGGTSPGSPIDDINEFALPEALRTDTQAGYTTANFGKWHLSQTRGGRTIPNQMGYHHYEGLLPGAVDDYYDWTKTTNGKNSQVYNYATTENVDNAIAIFQKCLLACQQARCFRSIKCRQIHFSQVSLSGLENMTKL